MSKKRTIFISGAASGIGLATAKFFASKNWFVGLMDINTQELEKALDFIGKENAIAVVGDVSDFESYQSAINFFAEKTNGQLDVLVNNAGVRMDNLMIWMEPEEWSKVINTNLNSFYYVSRPLLQDMIVNKFGRIINVVSLSGIDGMPGQANYSAAKAGVIGATKALAKEIGRKKVTVNAVAPGFIRTDMTKDLDEKQHRALIPIGRFGEPEEVAAVVAFLASEKASYITGEVISVNGGIST